MLQKGSMQEVDILLCKCGYVYNNASKMGYLCSC